MTDKMPEIIEGLSQIEYLLIFNAIVFGAIASEYFSGWGSMLRNRELVIFSPVQFVWSVYAFLLLVQNWFAIWPRSEYINDGLVFFYFSLLPMLLFYLISVVLFPQTKVNTEVNFKAHYEKNARILFLLFAIYLVVAIVGSIVYFEKDKGNILNQNVVRILGVAASMVAYRYNKNLWIHYGFLLFNFIGLVVFIFQIPD